MDFLHTLVRSYIKSTDLSLARHRLSKSAKITAVEAALLNRVSLEVDHRDDMYLACRGRHYLEVGISAIRCIEAAASSAPINTILDLPCGYGRVTRFLRSRYPSARIVGSEINPIALDFCSRSFSTEAVLSNAALESLRLPTAFDLIWCGSLVTHLDEARIVSLLKLFRDHLSPEGICVFTTHGELSAQWLRNNQEHYGLTVGAQKSLLAAYDRDGFGYAGYESQDYGVSIIAPDRIESLAEQAGEWHEVLQIPHGWANHQDVYAYSRRPQQRKIIQSPVPDKRLGSFGRAL